MQHIKLLLLSSTISMLFFYLIDVVSWFYFIVLLLIELIIWSHYKTNTNFIFYVKVCALYFGSLGGYGIVRFAQGHNLNDVSNIEILLLGSCVVLLLGLTLRSYIVSKKEDNHAIDKESMKIFQCRLDDYTRVYQYLNDTNIIGINGAWGTGKSYLIEYLKQQNEIKNEYEVITIDLLACNLDEIASVLLNELEKILTQYRVFSQHSKRLKKLLASERVGQHIKHIFWSDDESLQAGAFSGLKEDLKKIDKKVMIIYEDIDRITSTDTVKKIFAISEKLSGARLKIVYQYDDKNMEELNLKRDYLEKYIPYIVNITPISFFEIVKLLWTELEMDKSSITIEEIKELQFPIRMNPQVQKILGLNISLEYIWPDVSIRKVRVYLRELKLLLAEKDEFNDKENRKTVLRFLFVKHFLYEIYKQLAVGVPLTEALKLSYGTEEFSINSLLYKQRMENVYSEEQIKEIFNADQNKTKYAVLMLFGYRLVIKNDFDDMEMINKAEKNEKIDRLIWNLLYNGTSEKTDVEFAIKKLMDDVLSKEKTEWQQAWVSYQNDFFSASNVRMGNRTIFRFGQNNFETMFQAFYINDESEDNWMKLLEFYILKNGQQTINHELMCIVRHCDLSKKVVFDTIIRYINTLAIVGNLNDSPEYYAFLRKVFEGMIRYGFTRRIDSWQLEALKVGILEEDIQYFFDELLRETEQLLNQYGFVESIAEDIVCVQSFAIKNLKLIKHNEKMGLRKHRWETEYSSRYLHQETIDYLTKLKENNPKKFDEEVERLYHNGEIYLSEMAAIMKC